MIQEIIVERGLPHLIDNPYNYTDNLKGLLSYTDFEVSGAENERAIRFIYRRRYV